MPSSNVSSNSVRDLTKPSPAVVLDLLEAFRRSKTMFTAVSLGVFDSLQSQAKSASVLARDLKCDPTAMEILLDSCVALGLLARSDDGFVNTPEAETYLCSSSPDRMTGYIHYSNRVMWQMWANLEDAIREGSNRWKQTFDMDGPLFSHFFKDADAMNEFLMGMNGFGMITSPRIVESLDLSRFKRMVDLGGATGHLTIAACQRYPALQGVVFDLPHALDLAKQMIQQSEARDRLSVVGGDFFIDTLPPADLYALGRILHDWGQANIELLLKKIYDALPRNGALLIGEKIIDADRSGPTWALMQSLNMLVCTEGHERTLAEYGQLLTQAGFREIIAVRTSLPLDGILATK